MGFYIRKSFKAGPFRLNISKGGLGVSAGVTGARVGVDSKGRAYTHAGRYGLYHRQFHSGSGGTEKVRIAGSAPRLLDEEIHVTTGATYPTKLGGFDSVTAPGARRNIAQPKRPALGLLLIAVSLLIVLGVLSSGTLSPPWWLATAFILGSLALVAFGIRNMRIAWMSADLQRAVSEAFQGESNAADTQIVEERVRDGRLPTDDIQFVGKRAFAQLILEVVEDGRVEQDEKAKLAWCERTFDLGGDFVMASKVEAFQTVFLRAIADRVMTAEEEAALYRVQTELGVPEHAITEMQEIIEELAEVRRVRDGQLREISTAHKLQRDEKCYYEGPGRLLKYKILRSFTEDGIRHKMKGFEVAKEGALLLTSKCVTLRHEGTSNIQYKKILDVEVDADRNLLTLVKDGVQKPVFITTPGATQAGAIIAQLAGV